MPLERKPWLASRAELKFSFAAASEDRLVLSRLAGAMLTTLTTIYWLGPVLPLAWFAGVVAYEVLLSPYVARTITESLAARSPKGASVARVAMVLFGAIIYTVPCVVAWFVARDAYMGIAFLYLACVITHAAVFRAADAAIMVASMGPAALVAIAMPFLTGLPTVPAVLTALGVVQFLVVKAMAIRNRREIIERSVMYQMEAVDAERANSAKSQFLATMSHELRTPLNAVIGYAEIVEEDVISGRLPDIVYAERIASAGRSLLVLVNDILDLSKLESGDLELRIDDVRVSELVRNAVEISTPMALANGNRFTLDLDPVTDDVSTDSGRFSQCILNLVSNAAKFTENGEVRISTSSRMRGGERMMVVKVEDDGIGMSAALMDRIFEPFVQGDSSMTRTRGGVGLGLVLTKRLSHLLRGDVQINSQPGRGTTCILEIPVGAPKRLQVAA